MQSILSGKAIVYITFQRLKKITAVCKAFQATVYFPRERSTNETKIERDRTLIWIELSVLQNRYSFSKEEQVQPYILQCTVNENTFSHHRYQNEDHKN